MRTLVYIYDETKVTNNDYIILSLTDSFDDGDSSYLSVAEYNINCPYHGGGNCLNKHKGNKYGTKEYNQGCIKCKLAWLEREYDTYPSEDGKWEPEEE